MAKRASVNLNPATGAAAIFLLKEFMKTHGWTVVASSDGTTYNAAGDQITHAGSGANGMANNRAWFRIRDPGGEREWTFQRITQNYQWRVKYSALDRFTGGAPNATTTPSATDEAVIFGSGTDATPGATQFLNADGIIGRWHIVLRDDANARGVYAWYAWATDPGGSACDTLLGCEPMDPATIPALAGTRAAPATGDPDPCIVFAGYNSSGTVADISTTSGALQNTGASAAWGWFGMNGTNGNIEAFERMTTAFLWGGSSYGNFQSTTASAGVGVNPYDGRDELLPLWWGRGAGVGSSVGVKGIGQYIRGKTAPRAYPDTIDLATDAYVYVDDLLLPWPNGVTPLT